MRALLDVNVLIALLDEDHVHHAAASQWLSANLAAGWASCPITQKGCVRILSQSGYPNPLPAPQVIERLREAAGTAHHTFWPDDVSLLDGKRLDAARVLGPKQVTDTYLLALAVAHKGRFVSFDRGIALAAVPGAKPQHLVVL